MTNELQTYELMDLSDNGIATVVTIHINDQLFGLPVEVVRQVLKDQRITPIPKAPREIKGSLNLRGRIVTVINLRERLGLNSEYQKSFAYIVVEHDNDVYALMIDKIGDVMRLKCSDIEALPSNLMSNWQKFSKGIYRLQDRLMLILDIQHLLDI
jgi:purine-binding chemotaxis protein CheW